MPESRPGTLFLVATPIGNLEDITLRALRVLRDVDLIAAEDTRHTAKLLVHFGIQTPTTSVHEHNEVARSESLVARLSGGARIALVSDAGTPAVSDPGFRLVRAAIAAGVRVEALPGPSAVLAALTCSGLPTDAFVFVGFPPSRARARDTWFEQLRAESRTIIFFEAPHRVRDSLAAAQRILGDRDVAVARELTKLHEEFLRGPVSAVLERLAEPRGEFTIVLAGAPTGSAAGESPEATDLELLAGFNHEVAGGAGRREAVVAVARKHGLHARAVYGAIERARKDGT
jgi:16S rRNA (cytidine1402-2'-O)-methyltransferase